MIKLTEFSDLGYLNLSTVLLPSSFEHFTGQSLRLKKSCHRDQKLAKDCKVIMELEPLKIAEVEV
jgi:hypothetical protein